MRCNINIYAIPLICIILLLNVSDVYGDATYKVRTENIDRGLVYADDGTKTPVEGDYREEFSGKQSGSFTTHKIVMYASAKAGFYFDKWRVDTKRSKGTPIDKSKDTDNPRTVRLDVVTGTYKLGEYTALFQSVMVNGVQNSSYSISTTDLNQSGTCDVVFNVNKATSDRDYQVVLTQAVNAFSVVNTAFNGTQVTVTVKYTDHNHHGSNIDQATLTLKSKGDNSFASATINASSNLTPSFAIGSSLAFGSTANPIYVGDRLQKSIAATSKNRTASQPAPASSGQTGAVWNASISGTDASAFSVGEHPADGNCLVTFVPTEEKTYSATLTLTVQYTDAHNNTISSEAHTVALSGVAKTATVSKIEFTPSSYVFPDMRVADAEATKVISVSKQNVSNVVYSWIPEFADIFQYDASVEGQVTISAKPAAPGTYSTTLVASGTNTLAGHTSETTTNNLPISVKIGLQKPTLLSGATLDSIYLKWNTIQFAETYTIYEINGTTKTPVTPNRRVENRKEIIAVFASSATKTYQVEAKGTYNGEEYTVWTDAVTQKVGNLTATSVPYWNLYTGTVCTSVGGFSGTIIKKTRVDLSHVFDKNGKALFDELYVFGETVSSDGTASIKAATADAVGTAVTPCYVFTKATDGISYDYDRTIDNVGTGSKKLPSEGTHNWTTTGSLKLYFTGWCPFGSNGKDKNDEGIIYIKGAAGTSVDIYLEDCYLYARRHTPNGNSIHKDNMPYYTGEKNNPSQGSASAIVVECTSTQNAKNPFYVSVHSMGENILYSEMGCSAYQKVLLVKDSYVGQYSASFYVRPTADNSYTTLTFDDKWPTDVANMTQHRRTNGYLRFQKSSRNSPSIDIGNANTIVNFNGGQIELQNSQPAGNGYYENTLAICHRTGDAVVYGFPLKYGYGICADGVGGTVNFNDGSVNTIKFKPWKEEYNAYYEPLDKDGNSTALRCPKNTFVFGGTHNSDIQACNAVSAPGASPTDGICALVKADHLVDNRFVDAETRLVQPGFYPFDETLCTVGPEIGKTLSAYYALHSDKYANGKYGAESITPDKDGYVHLWVPGEGRKSYNVTPWIVAMTEITAKNPLQLNGGKLTMGGPQNVPIGENEMVNNLMYAKLDGYMATILQNKNRLGQYTYEIPLQKPESRDYQEGVTPEDVGTEYYNSITNDEDYIISQAIYYITPIVEADKWFAFCPPFDVSNVYVLESYPEAALSKNNSRADALKEQAKSNLDASAIIASKIALAIESGSNVGYTTCYNAFIDYAYHRDTTSRAYPRPVKGYSKYASTDYKTNYVGQRLLTAFSKGNWDAEYFLYKSQNNTWEFDGTNFTTDWQIAAPVTKMIGTNERPVVMEAGNIYALMFPYCSNCEGVDEYGTPIERTEWDYWTGKLLIMEGFGPQTIKGKNNHTTTTAPYSTPNSAVLRGNPTFADLQVEQPNAYFQVGKNVFEHSTNAQMGKIQMGGVFMLANGSVPSAAPANAKYIHVRSGLVTYDQETETTTGVPTIAGGRTLIVNSVDGGLTVIPVVAQQVGIYGSAGQLIASDYMTDETTLSLPAGIYMVRGEKETAKVIVR